MKSSHLRKFVNTNFPLKRSLSPKGPRKNVLAGVLLTRGPTHSKFFCLKWVRKSKGPRKVYHIAGVPLIQGPA